MVLVSLRGYKMTNEIGLQSWGYNDFYFKQANLFRYKNLIPARIITEYKGQYRVITEHGEKAAKLKGSYIYSAQAPEDYPAVGDFVLVNYNESGDAMIHAMLDRKSKFSRICSKGREDNRTSNEQVVAANFDYVFIMSSLNHDLNLRRIERYLTAAWQSGASPIIILTKADLVEDYAEQIRAVEKVSSSVGVFAVSAKTGYGISELSNYLIPCKTVVFLGSSGVGKSSLVNTLAKRDGHEEEIMEVNEIREDDSKGRHTTTHRQLIKLNSGVMIIDTPGMRELGMWDVSIGLSEAFTDVKQYFGRCKFSDCKHSIEPGCAVKAAIENGELPLERWISYLQLKREAKFSDDKVGHLRDKQQWHKEIAKYNKSKKPVKFIKGEIK